MSKNKVYLPKINVEELNPDSVNILSANKNWYLGYHQIIELKEQYNLTGKGVKIGVVDTAIQDHKDLPKKTYSKWFTKEKRPRVWSSHGTSVAGVIWANNHNLGFHPIAEDAQIFELKALSERGVGDRKDLIAAINHATELELDVLNISAGIPRYDEELSEAINNYIDAGGNAVCASGNSGSKKTLAFPAMEKKTFSVGSHNKMGEVSVFSQDAEGLDILAPGEDIPVIRYLNKYGFVNGTSFAAPFISGLIALLLEAKIKITDHLICKTATKLRGKTQSCGIINPQLIMDSELENATKLDKIYIAHQLLGDYLSEKQFKKINNE